MPQIKLCIVEDLDEIREGMIALLQKDGRFEVQAGYASAEAAFNELEAWLPDIVIMDINLPGMNGIECLRKLKPLCPKIQFMMFTIYEDDEKIFEALNAGASGYMLKSTPLSRIGDAVVELYEGGSPMSTQIARKLINRLRVNQESTDMKLLSPREYEILELLSKGFLYKEIALKKSITTGTVRQHIHNIYEKLHVQNRTEAVNKLLGR